MDKEQTIAQLRQVMSEQLSSLSRTSLKRKTGCTKT